ncbi:MAG: cytosolic protein [Ignavibacteriae bacterium]|nr:cytosolic protein [Ignavibacteriota bacterium]MCB9214530.1 cytosolic protein [Ignavibacteria bacterium]
MAKQTPDYDSPWKEIIEVFFPEFITFYFPHAAEEIDWNRGYTFLDNELRQIAHDATLGRRYVDKLVRLWQVSGDEEWVLIHVEVQTGQEQEFAERMYIYNNRIYDKYRKRVVSFAILADDSVSWRPDHFVYQLWGCEVSLRYPTVKLIDWRDRLGELLQTDNIFAGVTLAHIRMLETRQDIPERLRWKVILSQGLYELGYGQQQIQHLFRFIDWLMFLPTKINQQYYKAMTTYEETGRRPFVSIFEEMGMKKGMKAGHAKGLEEGLQQSIREVIQTMFGQLSNESDAQIDEIHPIENLRTLFRSILKAESIEQVEESIRVMRENV